MLGATVTIFERETKLIQITAQAHGVMSCPKVGVKAEYQSNKNELGKFLTFPKSTPHLILCVCLYGIWSYLWQCLWDFFPDNTSLMQNRKHIDLITWQQGHPRNLSWAYITPSPLENIIWVSLAWMGVEGDKFYLILDLLLHFLFKDFGKLSAWKLEDKLSVLSHKSGNSSTCWDGVLLCAHQGLASRLGSASLSLARAYYFGVCTTACDSGTS